MRKYSICGVRKCRVSFCSCRKRIDLALAVEDGVAAAVGREDVGAVVDEGGSGGRGCGDSGYGAGVGGGRAAERGARVGWEGCGGGHDSGGWREIRRRLEKRVDVMGDVEPRRRSERRAEEEEEEKEKLKWNSETYQPSLPYDKITIS